jgi:hypothetical protein
MFRARTSENRETSTCAATGMTDPNINQAVSRPQPHDDM